MNRIEAKILNPGQLGQAEEMTAAASHHSEVCTHQHCNRWCVAALPGANHQASE